MDSEPTDLDVATQSLNEMKKQLEAAHVATIAAVQHESSTKRDFLTALEWVKQEEDTLAEFATVAAAAQVLKLAAAAAQLVEQTASIVTGTQDSMALETLADARKVAMEMLAVARKLALETLADAGKLALDRSERKIEMDLIFRFGPTAAPPHRQ